MIIIIFKKKFVKYFYSMKFIFTLNLLIKYLISIKNKQDFINKLNIYNEQN
jgi:hypothetical protein